MKSYCPHWHRDASGDLERGKLVREVDCKARFDLYTPDPADMKYCPYALLECSNPHSHPPPHPAHLPPPIQRTLEGFLVDLGAGLADASPRRLSINSGFITALRNHMGQTGQQDPCLSELHPSLGNASLVSRMINGVRKRVFPHGTGFESAVALLHEHSTLPPNLQYVRLAARVHVPGDREVDFVILMSHPMSQSLMKARGFTIDSSFRKLHAKEILEFEMECWDTAAQKSVTLVRAFFTSQTAEAHLYLFRQIFRIARKDTGLELYWHFRDGQGVETVTADGHRGQALGLGLFVLEETNRHHAMDPNGKARIWINKHPWELISYFYKYCTVHYHRNVMSLRGSIPHDVYLALVSLASTQPFELGLDHVLSLIREKGGQKAKDFLDDKEPFALRGLYQPLSNIPVEIWNAAPSTTNGNEQAHRNSYRDGRGLSIFAAIMRSMQYDLRADVAAKLAVSHSIFSRDQPSTHYFRATQALKKKVRSTMKGHEESDKKIAELQTRITKLETRITNQWMNGPQGSSSSAGLTLDARREKFVKDYQKLSEQAKTLLRRGSGKEKITWDRNCASLIASALQVGVQGIPANVFGMSAAGSIDAARPASSTSSSLATTVTARNRAPGPLARSRGYGQAGHESVLAAQPPTALMPVQMHPPALGHPYGAGQALTMNHPMPVMPQTAYPPHPPVVFGYAPGSYYYSLPPSAPAPVLTPTGVGLYSFGGRGAGSLRPNTAPPPLNEHGLPHHVYPFSFHPHGQHPHLMNGYN